MFRALKVFVAFLSLVLSIQAVVTTTANVGDVKESSVNVTVGKHPFTVTILDSSLNGPVVLVSQPSSVSANLRKKEENKVDLEGM
jgi:hypothetical protein